MSQEEKRNVVPASIKCVLYRAFELLGAKSDLLGLVGSWGETYTDAEFIKELEFWNGAELAAIEKRAHDLREVQQRRDENARIARELVEKYERGRKLPHPLVLMAPPASAEDRWEWADPQSASDKPDEPDTPLVVEPK